MRFPLSVFTILRTERISAKNEMTSENIAVVRERNLSGVERGE